MALLAPASLLAPYNQNPGLFSGRKPLSMGHRTTHPLLFQHLPSSVPVSRSITPLGQASCWRRPAFVAAKILKNEKKGAKN
jgi:hypothetical protein